MNIVLLIIFAILILIIIFQQCYIKKLEDELFNALKFACERLKLIPKDATVEDILKLRENQKED